MNNNAIKLFISKPQNIFLLGFFVLGIFGFITYETYSIARNITLLIILIFLLYFFYLQENSILIYPTLYLNFFNVYNFYYTMNWPLWAVMIILIVIIGAISYIFINHQYYRLNKIYKFFYIVLFCLIQIEIFLTLIFWTTDPRGKAIILLTVFYVLQGLVSAWLDEKFVWSKISPYIVIGIMLIFGIIMTSPWLSY